MPWHPPCLPGTGSEHVVPGCSDRLRGGQAGVRRTLPTREVGDSGPGAGRGPVRHEEKPAGGTGWPGRWEVEVGAEGAVEPRLKLVPPWGPQTCGPTAEEARCDRALGPSSLCPEEACAALSSADASLLRRARPFSPQASRQLPLAKRGENPAQGCCLRACVRMVQCCSLIRHLPHLGAPGAVSLA